MAPTHEPDVLAGVADAILEGTAVDWDSAEAWVDREHADLLPQLKIVSAVADLHRSIPDSTTGPRQWGHLELLERIGEGAFGEVYRAWDTRLDREVALKLLPEGSASADARSTAIIEEGRLLARVRHPSVVTIYGAERIGGRVGLWMEFIKGRTLEQLVADGRQFAAREVVDVGLELARALAAVHAAGLLHRDIKAQNVMLADDGRVVLMDFGTGLEAVDSDRAAPAGTPRYLAPELFAGGSPTHASDLYSLGVLLFRLATGSYPVHAEDMAELRAAHGERARFRTRDVQRDVSKGLARVIDRLLDPDPGHRGDHATLAAALEAQKRGRLSSPWTRAALVAAGFLVAALIWNIPGRAPVVAVARVSVSGFESDGDLIGDGLAQGIVRHMTGIDGLHLRSPVSSPPLMNAAGMREFGHSLNANLLVQASIVRSDRALRVTARLIDVSGAGDDVLWGEVWDGDLGNTFAIFDRIARGVAGHLGLTVARTPIPHQLDAAAQRAYLTARGLLDRRGIQQATRAAALFDEVIRLHPTYAPAWAGKANAYGQAAMNYEGIPIGEALPILRDSAERAITLDPSLSEAHAAIGLLHTRDFKWDAAVEAYRRAIALDGTSTHAATSYILWVLTPLERFDEAEDVLAAARINDPTSVMIQREWGNIYLYTQRYLQAVAVLDAVRTVDPSLPFVRLDSALIWAGRTAEAIPALEAAGPGRHGYLAHAYVHAGRRADAERLVALAQPYPQRLALVQAALGNKDAAFDALDRMMETEFHRVPRLIVYPELASLRDHPRYAALRQRLNLPAAGTSARR